jgi:hypothetical protein
VNTGRILLPSSAEIQPGDGQDLLIINDSCISIFIEFDPVYVKRENSYSNHLTAIG